MSIATPDVLALVDALLPILDEEIALLTRRRAQLESLSVLLVERDDEATGRLLDEMEQTETLQADTDRKLQALRSALAGALGCGAGDVRLARLVGELPAGLRSAVDFRRQQIILLVDAFRRQHLCTAMQLVECIRVNRMLLEGLFGEGRSVTTYDMHGTAARALGSGLVDAER